MNNHQIARWILSLPEDIQALDCSSIVHGQPFTAKRLVAYRFKDGSGAGIYVESMGTHLAGSTASEMEFVDTFSHGDTRQGWTDEEKLLLANQRVRQLDAKVFAREELIVRLCGHLEHVLKCATCHYDAMECKEGREALVCLHESENLSDSHTP